MDSGNYYQILMGEPYPIFNHRVQREDAESGMRAEVQGQEPSWKERKKSQRQAYGVASHKAVQREGRKMEGGEIRKDHGWWLLGKCPIQNKSVAKVLFKPSVLW